MGQDVTCRILVSYHFHRDTDLAALVAAFGEPVDLFADSGAFSAYTKGSVINLADYAAWLKDWDRLFAVKSNLDVIGDHEASARNLEKLPGTLPVFHPGAPWSVLENLCKEYGYVALGGVAGKLVRQRADVMRWFVKCFQTAREYGAVFHGFGVTSASLAKKLPFYSLDSSSWRWGVRHGMLYLWDTSSARGRSVHFRNPAELSASAALLREHGLEPGLLNSPSFLNTPGARATDSAALMAASIVGYRKMERHLLRVHRVPAPALSRTDEAGTKIYMALPGGTQASAVAPFARAREIMP